MPFVAKNRVTGERIDITAYIDPKSEITANINDFVCLYCGTQMTMRAGMVRTPHFAHKIACSSQYEYQPESPNHLAGKALLVKQLRGRYPQSSGVKIELEAVIPDIGRIADVLVSFPNGYREAYEIQISTISPLEFEKRSLSYQSVGITPMWFFSDAARSEGIDQLCRSHGWRPGYVKTR